MSQPKYIVFKSEDWDAFRDAMIAHPQGIIAAQDVPTPLPVVDAEVIRHQDITSAPIFYLYSQQLHHFIDMAQMVGMPLENEGHLLKIAEHFGEAAVKAEQSAKKKLPD